MRIGARVRFGTGLLCCKSWPEFLNHLKSNGVEVELVMRRDGSKDLKDVQGMRFKKDGYTFKASQIRRGLSYAVILSKLNANEEKEQQRTINSQARQIQAELPRPETYSEQQKHNEPSIGIPSLGLFDTSNPVYDSVNASQSRYCSSVLLPKADRNDGYRHTPNDTR